MISSETVWDATTVGLLMTCPRKYQFRILKEYGYRSEALDRGSVYHAALAAFYKADTVECGLLAGLREILNFEGLHDKAQVAKAFVWYTENYKNDYIEVFDCGGKCVELSFRLPLPIKTPGGEPYTLCGHIDTVVQYKANGMLAILEHKTTGAYLSGYYFSKFDFNLQINLYLWALRCLLPEELVSHVLINAIHIREANVDFARHIVLHTNDQVNQTVDTVCEWIKLGERFIQEKNFPANLGSCYQYGQCSFLEVCKLPTEMQEDFLAENFELDPWKPWESR